MSSAADSLAFSDSSAPLVFSEKASATVQRQFAVCCPRSSLVHLLLLASSSALLASHAPVRVFAVSGENSKASRAALDALSFALASFCFQSAQAI